MSSGSGLNSNPPKAWTAVEQMLTAVARKRLINVPQMEPLQKERLVNALTFYLTFLKRNYDARLILRETAAAYRRIADIYRRFATLGPQTTAVTVECR